MIIVDGGRIAFGRRHGHRVAGNPVFCGADERGEHVADDAEAAFPADFRPALRGLQMKPAVSFAVEGGGRVSGLLEVPASARACYVLAHGAGAGMRHPFMEALAQGLAARGIATLRYQFPYMERGLKRTDSPKVAHAAVRAAVEAAAGLAPGLALVAGGKSFGGRMTSQAQAEAPLPGVRGLAFLGFPLHAAGRPSDERGAHLLDVKVPMLFLQGTRDRLAEPRLLKSLLAPLGERATLELFAEADHSFHVPARSGRTDAQVMAALLGALAGWVDSAVC